MNEKIGFFGGTFDPIHLGHLIIAEWVREANSLSRIVFIPSGNPPHKSNQTITSPEHRLAMTRLAVADNEKFSCTDLEIKKKEKSFTVETLRVLNETRGEDRLFWIIGSDSLLDLPNWYRPDEIFRLAEVIVYPRPGFPIDQAEPRFREQCRVVEAPFLGISATEIRRRVRQGKSIRYLVPAAVEKYILQHQLYRGEHSDVD